MVGGVNEETLHIFKTNTTKDYSKLTRVTNVCVSGS